MLATPHQDAAELRAAVEAMAVAPFIMVYGGARSGFELVDLAALHFFHKLCQPDSAALARLERFYTSRRTVAPRSPLRRLAHRLLPDRAIRAARVLREPSNTKYVAPAL